MFGDQAVAAAMIDRVVHHADVGSASFSNVADNRIRPADHHRESSASQRTPVLSPHVTAMAVRRATAHPAPFLPRIAARTRPALTSRTRQTALPRRGESEGERNLNLVRL
ncbi:MAG: hypothetical protein Q8Q19_02855 [Microbacterium sp.]|nr:hypothetical protein [Microbacterium sp.]MDP3949579.1 hypothetical protein [Microbacterium sp.]